MAKCNVLKNLDLVNSFVFLILILYIYYYLVTRELNDDEHELHDLLVPKNLFTLPISQLFCKTVFSKETTVIANYSHAQLIQWGHSPSHPFIITILADANAITAAILEWRLDIDTICKTLFHELQRN